MICLNSLGWKEDWGIDMGSKHLPTICRVSQGLGQNAVIRWPCFHVPLEAACVKHGKTSMPLSDVLVTATCSHMSRTDGNSAPCEYRWWELGGVKANGDKIDKEIDSLNMVICWDYCLFLSWAMFWRLRQFIKYYKRILLICFSFAGNSSVFIALPILAAWNERESVGVDF